MNLAGIASGESEDSEYVHQARVAIRRLRTAIRLFDAAPLRNLDVPARALAKALGLTRERDVLIESVAPALAEAGAPTTDPAIPASAADARNVVRHRDNQFFVIDLLAGELVMAQSLAPVIAPAGPQLIARLSRWHRQVRRDARLFTTLDDDMRHRLRRRMKRLRYGVEFCRTLCSNKRYQRFLENLSRAQEALGRYNDLIEALASYRSQIEADPRVWFAVGWLTAEAKAQSLVCETTLDALCQSKAPWKNRYLDSPKATPHPSGRSDHPASLAPIATRATSAGAPPQRSANRPIKPT
jgi:CHAD domain-containing protein